MNEGQRAGPNATFEEATDLRVHVEALTLEAECLRQAIVRRDEELARRKSEVAGLTAERDALGARLRSVEASTIWRATSSLRILFARSPLLTRMGRRALKLVWWTLTLQLAAKLRARRSLEAETGTPALQASAQAPG